MHCNFNFKLGWRIALRDGGTLYWLLTDHLGGTAYTVSGTTRTGELRYRPFGVTRFASGTTPTTYRFTGQREEAALGHFLSPDTLVPEPGNALDHHRYAYVRFNPLKYTDPSGHCPTPPASLGPTLCMALFIQPSTIAAGPITVHGDGRGFSNASDPAASRGFIWIPVAEPQNFHAQMNPSGYLASVSLPLSTAPQGPAALTPARVIEGMLYFPPSAENRWTVKEGANGAIEVSYDLVISGPLEWSGAAPHINGTVRFTPNRAGSFDASFERDGFPWAEAYFHDGKGKVQTLFRDPAVRGNPHDLFAIEPNLPLQKAFVRWAQGLLGLGDPIVSKRLTPR
jgi:RHS repeat-associated protein